MLLAICCALLPRPGAAQVRGEIFGPGTTRYPIAVAPLEVAGAGGGALGERFAAVLANDLALSGYFTVLDRPGAPTAPGESEPPVGAIDFGAWSAVGALALVHGTLELRTDAVTVEARLFDVPQRREVVGPDGAPCNRRYTAATSEVPRMAHRFADRLLYCFTGEPGPFDTRIAFVSTRAGRFKEMYELGLEGGEPRQLTDNRTINLAPSWSPDARFLLFTSYKDRLPKLYRFDRATRTEALVSAAPGLNIGGAWSPDGRLIAVALEEAGNPDIFLVDRDGHRVRQLTTHPAIDISPAWSPDGRQLAFCSARSGSPQIYVVGVDGGRPQRITFQGTYNTDPAWSPRGDVVAFAGRVGGHFQILTVPPHGGPVRQVTSDSGDSEEPSWSPDGRYLVYSSRRGGARHLYLTDLSGSPPRQLTRGKGDDTTPAWSSRLK